MQDAAGVAAGQHLRPPRGARARSPGCARRSGAIAASHGGRDHDAAPSRAGPGSPCPCTRAVTIDASWPESSRSTQTRRSPSSRAGTMSCHQLTAACTQSARVDAGHAPRSARSARAPACSCRPASAVTTRSISTPSAGRVDSNRSSSQLVRMPSFQPWRLQLRQRRHRVGERLDRVPAVDEQVAVRQLDAGPRAPPARRPRAGSSLYDAPGSSRSTSGSTAWNASTSASMRSPATGARSAGTPIASPAAFRSSRRSSTRDVCNCRQLITPPRTCQAFVEPR